MSETNGKPNPVTGKRTHRIYKRIGAKKKRFAGYARDGVVFVNSKPVAIHEYIQDKGSLGVEIIKENNPG